MLQSNRAAKPDSAAQRSGQKALSGTAVPKEPGRLGDTRYIASQAADARLNVELETEGMTLNIGPQHPATHGTLRIIARLDGEQVVWAEPGCGYMHRGYEKLTEVRTFPQVTTLINRIAPELSLRTAEISEQHRQGQHTTTFAEMYDLPSGARIIDTPGIKEFGLIDIEGWELADYFPEMRALKGECKYYNCSHAHEPGCAIKRAVENGKIPESRYKSYLSMLSDEDNRR